MAGIQNMEYKCEACASVTRKGVEESNDKYYKRVRDSFLENVFRKTYSFKDKKIKFQTWQRKIISEDGTETSEYECFYHTISSLDDKGNLTRKIDLERYQKCLLTFVILDLCSCDHVKCQLLTIKPDNTVNGRLTLYCDRFNYVIVLEEHLNYFRYITSFPVSAKNLDKYR